MEHLNTALAFAAAHPVEGLVVLSAIVNTALALRSPERLVAALERHPRGGCAGGAGAGPGHRSPGGDPGDPGAAHRASGGGPGGAPGGPGERRRGRRGG